tara:strand:- start:5709 stop:6566 length:858 start_codon:yes stop_codon:yes gene_type:complete
MGFRRTVTVANINGVAAASRATIDLPVDRRYHMVLLKYTESGVLVTQANMEAALTNIRVNLDARTQREFSAAQLNVLNASNGAQWAFRNGYLPIYFSEPWQRTPGDEDIASWALQGNVATFQIEIDIAAGRVNPKLEVSALIDNARMPSGAKLPLGPIVKTRRLQIPVTAVGVRTVMELPRASGDYLALHCFETAANDISKILISVDQNTAFERDRTTNTALLQNAGFVPAATVFDAIFDETRRMADGLPMTRGDNSQVGEFRLDFTMAVANSFTIVAELIGKPD